MKEIIPIVSLCLLLYHPLAKTHAQQNEISEDRIRVFLASFNQSVLDGDIAAFGSHFTDKVVVRETNKQDQNIRVTQEGRKAVVDAWRETLDNKAIKGFSLSILDIELDPDSAGVTVRALERCEWKAFSMATANICEYQLELDGGKILIAGMTNRPVTRELFPPVLASIPFDDFYISVNTGSWMDRPDGLEEIKVNLKISRNVESDEGGEAGGSAGSISSDLNNFEFSSGQRMFPPDDVEVFLRAADEAMEKKPFSEEVNTRTYNGMMSTRYETVESERDWRIRVTRGGETAIFSASEGDRLRTALREAEVGKAWFRKLLEARDTPEPTPLARPPISDDLYLVATAGLLSLGDFAIEVGARRSFSPGYSTNFSLRFGNGNFRGSSMGGDWVEQLVEVSETALEAAKKGENYESGIGGNWSVVADKESKTAKITVIPGKFFCDREPLIGEIDDEKLKAIRSLIEEADLRREWFEENEDLFMKSPE